MLNLPPQKRNYIDIYIKSAEHRQTKIKQREKLYHMNTNKKAKVAT